MDKWLKWISSLTEHYTSRKKIWKGLEGTSGSCCHKKLHNHLFVHCALLHDEVRFHLLLLKGHSRICSDLQSKFINFFWWLLCKAWHKHRNFPDSNKYFWSHFISVNLIEQEEARCLERVWKSHKLDSLVQAGDINLLMLGKEAINLKEDERRSK